MIRSPARFQAFLGAFLVAVFGVVLFGAVVRATGSGAGCGAHWPVCNGEVIPASPSRATLIELTHRLTSGLLLMLTAGAVVWGFRLYPPGHRVRKGVLCILGFMLSEAAVGALLVLRGWVGLDASVARALAVSVHLLNTFLLLAAIVTTLEWARPREAGIGPRTHSGWVGVTTLGLLMVGMSGAIAALGDTLFPASSLAAGLAADRSSTSHFLVRLRSLHPLLASATTMLVSLTSLRALGLSTPTRRRARLVLMLLMAQLLVGAANLLLLAPIGLQLLHLLLADLLWIAWVRLAMAFRSKEAVPRSMRPLVLGAPARPAESAS